MLLPSRSALAGGSVLAVAAACLVALPVTVATAATPPTATTQTTTISLRTSTTAFPPATVHTGEQGINLTESGQLQRFVNRSHSPRPQVASGATMSPNAVGPSTWLPNVTPTPVGTGTPGVVTGWNGLSEHDNQVYAGFSVEPPDQGLCVGNGRVLEMINDVVRVDTTTGTPLATAYLNDFFGEAPYQFTTDPSCVFDQASGRFFATELTLVVDPATGNLTLRNYLDLAVSKTGDPAGGWNVYTIETTDNGHRGTPLHKDCPCIGDYPHLGTDAAGVYLTTNEYPWTSAPGVFGNNFNGAQLYALGKAAVTAGNASVSVTHLENIQVPVTSGARRPGFTLWPAQAAGTGFDAANNGTMHFVSSLAAEEARPDDFTGYGRQLASWTLTGTNSLAGRAALGLGVNVVGIGAYGIPPLANQKPGPTPLRDCLTVTCSRSLKPDQYAPEQEGGLDSSDTRILTAVYANGRVSTALDTAMLVSQRLEAGFEWVSLGVSGSAPTVQRRGYVGVDAANATYPTIATDTAGRGYVGFTLSGDNWFPSAAYARWSNGVGATGNVAAAGAAPEDGFCEYLYFNCAGTTTPQIRPRWGDYGYAAWDGSRFYVANEYIPASCTFPTFNADHTCGGTRTFLGNFGTRVTVLQ